MRLSAWDITPQKFQKDTKIISFRVHPNKWIDKQFREAALVTNLELRNQYTEKLQKVPPCKFMSMKINVERNGELFQEIIAIRKPST